MNRGRTQSHPTDSQSIWPAFHMTHGAARSLSSASSFDARRCCGTYFAREAAARRAACGQAIPGTESHQRILGETFSRRQVQARESPALRGFHGPGRTRTCDRRIMSCVPGVAPCLLRPYSVPGGVLRRPEFSAVREIFRETVLAPAPVLPRDHPALPHSCVAPPCEQATPITPSVDRLSKRSCGIFDPGT
jgi:hypothetical protein